MLITGSRLIDAPVMGLQTGSELARIESPIINPATLEIVAYEVNGPLLDQRPSLLRIADVREFSDIGVIIDSSDEFIVPDDVIKISELYKRRFQLEGLAVRDEKKRKIGKVDGYTLETGNFVIQQISVRRPLLQSFNDTHLLVHRSQIREINDREIVINSQAKVQEPTVARHAGYANPFRKHPQTEHTSSK